jgi:hypothetical protein
MLQVVGGELRKAKNPGDVFRVFREILQGVKLGVVETKEELREDFKRIDEEFDFKLNKRMLLSDCKITGNAIDRMNSHNYDSEITQTAIESMIENFGEEFFKNPLTQQFCDGVMVQGRLVMMGKDGEVKIIDARTMDNPAFAKFLLVENSDEDQQGARFELLEDAQKIINETTDGHFDAFVMNQPFTLFPQKSLMVRSSNFRVYGLLKLREMLEEQVN